MKEKKKREMKKKEGRKERREGGRGKGRVRGGEGKERKYSSPEITAWLKRTHIKAMTKYTHPDR